MLQNLCQRKVYGTVLGVILFRHTRMTIFVKKAMQEVAEKLKNWKYAAIRKEITENNEDWNNFYAAWSGITNSESFCSPILTYWSVVTYLRSSSSSYCLEFEKAWPRRWNAAKYTREYKYYWTRFWSSTCSTRSWRITQLFQEIWQHYWKSLSMSRILSRSRKLRIVGAKNHCNQYLYLAFQKERVENV